MALMVKADSTQSKIVTAKYRINDIIKGLFVIFL